MDIILDGGDPSSKFSGLPAGYVAHISVTGQEAILLCTMFEVPLIAAVCEVCFPEWILECVLRDFTFLNDGLFFFRLQCKQCATGEYK